MLPPLKKHCSVRPQRAHGQSFQEAGFQLNGGKNILSSHRSCWEMRWGNELSVTVHSPEAEDRLVTEVWRELLSGASDPRGRGCSGWRHGPLLQGCPVTHPPALLLAAGTVYRTWTPASLIGCCELPVSCLGLPWVPQAPGGCSKRKDWRRVA